MTDVKVEQCDRDAAGELARFLGESEAHVGRIIAGELDHTDIVLAFARHRQAAEKAQQERDAKVVETWDKIGWSRMHLIDLRIHIATAIRSQGHE